MTVQRRGRPRRYAEYNALVASLPAQMKKRPRYVSGIGVFRGARGETAWLKIHLPRGGTYNGRMHEPGSSVEIKKGHLSSWSWDELETARDELQRRADRGEPLEEEQVPLFSDYASEWLTDASTRLRSASIASAHLSKHLIPEFGQQPLDAIRVRAINRWISRSLQKRKPATVKRELDTLKVILNSAIRDGYLSSNPCDDINRITGISGRMRFLSSAETLRLLAAAEQTDNWLPDFILWCLHSGMRKGEVLSASWSDIREIDGTGTFIEVGKTKTDRPRLVACTKTMVQIIERQRNRVDCSEDRVFPITKMTLRRRWERARNLADLDDVTMHDLRRTHSTYTAAAGVDLRTLAERIGHTDLTMLRKHYAAIIESNTSESTVTIEETIRRLTDR